tara:strand:- start:15 stop:149 length:135 start_codon:yes stop_codon:yes gene_type:complete
MDIGSREEREEGVRFKGRQCWRGLGEAALCGKEEGRNAKTVERI